MNFIEGGLYMLKQVTKMGTWGTRSPMVLFALVLVVTLTLTACNTASVMEGEKETRVIYMTAVEPKGGSDKLPFPEEKLPEGGGYFMNEPDENGRWEVGTYRWEPGLVVAYEGEKVELHILGVNGNVHHSTITGYDIDFVVERGKVTVVEFKADRPGIFDIVCHDHLPTMQTQLLVLPRQ